MLSMFDMSCNNSSKQQSVHLFYLSVNLQYFAFFSLVLGVPSLSYTVMRFIIEHWQVMEKHLIVLPSALKLIITEYKSLKSAQHRINQSSIQHF